MPNQITAAGLETKTQAELVAEFTAAFQDIYGADINLDSDSPDGQMMMIFVQSVLDALDLTTQVYNTFDPDNAIGVVLDQRVAINGIQRQAGTYTVTDISLVADRALNLIGLDQPALTPYTVSDDAGNEWNLISSYSIPSSGTYALSFRSAVPGQVFTTPNTIANPVTIVLGITSINNPSTYTTLGINEESDVDLKIRRQRSIALSSQGYLAGLLAALENISEVSSAFVYENNTNSTDGDGIPAHSIWVIVGGTATDEQIANAIYRKRNAGCGMKGNQLYTVIQPDGTSFLIRWDEVENETVFIKFTVTSLDGTNPPNYAAIRAGIPTDFTPGVNVKANINSLATVIQGIDSNTLVTDSGFSTSASGVYTTTLMPSAKNKQFLVSSSNVIILPLYLTPTSTQIVASGSRSYAVLGGYGTYTYSMLSNPSGGSIGSVTGVYTAGSTASVVDVVKVVDSLSNSTTRSVSVV